ncbi:NUDIX domain-containing protein [Kerstersia gyiorum]|uniref:NUDIX domain-containing protein n=1 Tax=Kerstersia gyiorum TaxID=206506 RepID=UPI0020A0EC4E|nr:NUDIX hydrolase [Kerstersia gyiorum]MCP1632939.1 ADP-ribose pyrophosphatase [Kerstersia gyiorum]MCP1635529.1 ADP-ribose pyrophosphatase [Kerstersia gyiorum]MCP1671065.1 ADP-ribose pyrophosphatase [Kerstersia gyiorum]MCP1678280.1 ADP-ribose pyrophosphatase [Kerstersia gyiorum]MCP1682080.1 ADP-ribose pyrophosphatase [Kerstersia gyiorum]
MNHTTAGGALPPLLKLDAQALSDAHLRETLHERKEIYQGRLLRLREDTVRLPDGKLTHREYVVHPGATVVIPLFDDDHVLLERQFRYPVDQVIVEFPAGKLDAGEAPLVCGQRELLEETGYRASEWAYAGKLHLAIGYSDEVIHIFFARGLQGGERQLDEGEFLDVARCAIPDFLDACRTGLVTDAKTLACALWLQNAWEGKWQLTWQPAGSP